MTPAILIYTDRFVPERAAGCARGPVVTIRPKYKDKDLGLLQHELCHVRQWWRTLGLHSLFYLLSKRYRLACEVEAYAIQAQYYPDDRLPLFAFFIAKYYKLDVSPDEALDRLRATG